jgi:16S rRNA (cytidine1402-2'-O)-methyltransferase
MLYFVSRSIGNIEDTSLRAVKTLVSADVIICEDTRSFTPYYSRVQEIYKLSPEKKQKIIYFFKHDEFTKVHQVIEYLESGFEVALVTECGTPVVSDPGKLLLDFVIKKGLPYTSIPGPTAYINGLLMSGFGFEESIFIGFISRKPSDIEKVFVKYLHKDTKLVFYESPLRIHKTLDILHRTHKDSKVAICREMTKPFEEVIFGTPEELRDTNKIYKGELTVVVRI